MPKKKGKPMHHECIITGFGGQGVLLIGQILVTAGMAEGRHVTWYPFYGAEMRGGSAGCAVIVSDRKIGSPLVDAPGLLVAMSLPALNKFMPKVKQGGVILYNSSLIDTPPALAGVTAHAVPAGDIAESLKNPRVANMVMLGAMAALNIVGRDALNGAFRGMFGKKFANKPELLDLNEKAIGEGMRSIGG